MGKVEGTVLVIAVMITMVVVAMVEVDRLSSRSWVVERDILGA